jgi:PAS domain S-box-containing protein
VRPATIRPTGVERTFGADEIIVSKTDPQGRITYANDVFQRVSGYSEPELVGKPHSIVRHPDMPRVVFRVLWDTLAAGQEIFAYINNLAADGAHYWVLAHVTPSRRGGRTVGHHSNRRSPSREAVARADALYRDLLAAERLHARPADAMAASGALLEARLAELGRTYDEFVWDLIAPAPAGAR